MTTPYVEKLFAGKVKKLGDPNASHPLEKPWETGMFKNLVTEPLYLHKTGLTGDEVADKKHHGGPEKALFAYPLIYYPYWREKLQLNDIGIGAMGENLAVSGMDEGSVCIGDTYQFGEAVIQVSQPRQPCWKPARRFQILDFALQIQQTGKTGWYFRVLKEGYVAGEKELTLLERPYPQWTIATCNEVMHEKTADLERARQLHSCAFLAKNWKETLAKRLAGEKSSSEKRLYGQNKA